MPRLGPARAAARRRQILDAAIVCFAQRGFHKSTLQDVVRQSGLSPGSIYSHFSGKDDIIHAVIDERHRGDLRNVQRAAAADSLAEGLSLLAEAFLPARPLPQDRAWRRLAVQLWAESLHDAKLLRAVRDGVEQPLGVLSALLRNAQRWGELPRGLQPRATARVLIAVFQGIALQQTWDDEVDADACLRTVRRLLRPVDG